MNTRNALAALLAGAALTGALLPASAAPTKHKSHRAVHTVQRHITASHRRTAAHTSRARSGTSNITVTPMSSSASPTVGSRPSGSVPPPVNYSESVGVGPGTGVTGPKRPRRVIRPGATGQLTPPPGTATSSPSSTTPGSGSTGGSAAGATTIDPAHPLPPAPTNPNAPEGTSGTTNADSTGSSNGTGSVNGGTAGANGGTSADGSNKTP